MVAGTARSEDEVGSTKMTKPIMIVAGIDTGKAVLDIALHPSGATTSLPNDAAGHQKLRAWLVEHRVERVGIEASGGYERRVLVALRVGGLAVRLLQPGQVRAFARAKLRRAKTDKIDAGLIADYVATMPEPTDRLATDPRMAGLAEALRLIEQIEQDRARAKTRLEAYHDPRLRRALQREITRLEQRLAAEIALLMKEIAVHDDLVRRLALIESIDGIGRRTAIALLVLMPELGHVDREEAAALAGLAPYDNQSGSRDGPRHIAGGRGRVRRALYNAAMPAAMRWNAELVDLYARLAQDKPHKKALVACARKLVVFANAVLARGTPWTKIAGTIPNGC